MSPPETIIERELGKLPTSCTSVQLVRLQSTHELGVQIVAGPVTTWFQTLTQRQKNLGGSLPSSEVSQWQAEASPEYKVDEGKSSVLAGFSVVCNVDT